MIPRNVRPATFVVLALIGFAGATLSGCGTPLEEPDGSGDALDDAPTVVEEESDEDDAPTDSSPAPDVGDTDETDAPDDTLDPAPVEEDEAPPAAEDACGRPPPQGGAWTVMHEGVARTFHVRLPSSFDNEQPTPLVLSFHGRAVNAALQEAGSGFTATGDAEGFIVVYPEGLGAQPSWNAGACCGESMQENVDDVGFVDAMLDRLESELCIDTARVYANGLSAGGYMSYALACERADRFAAVASVAGMTAVFPCSPARPIPVLHFHGTDDAIVPYEPTSGFSAMSVDNQINAWAERNGCAGPPSVFLNEEDVLCERYDSCNDGAEVALCTIDGGGHQWPGGVSIPFLGANTDAISATQMMWDFFSAHALN
jgi:polyhydroxybutyrate depolymerase